LDTTAALSEYSCCPKVKIGAAICVK